MYPAMCDFDVLSLYAQATDVMLSPNHARWAKTKFTCHALSAKSPSNAPVSSRLFVVMLPVGFSAVTKLFCMSRGHWNDHKNGVSVVVLLHHTPPAPCLQASIAYNQYTLAA